MESSKYLFVMGGPGSGKGTLSENLLMNYGDYNANPQLLPELNGLMGGPFSFVFLSVGDLLREELTRFKSGQPSEHGKTIDEAIKGGTILPGHISTGLIRSAIEKAELLKPARSPLKPLYLIDGFPRSKNNLDEFERQLGPCRVMINLQCTEKTMVDRLLTRGKTGQRSDDVIDIIRKRLVKFQEETMPVLEHFKESEDKLLIQVDAEVDASDVFYFATKAINKVLIEGWVGPEPLEQADQDRMEEERLREEEEEEDFDEQDIEEYDLDLDFKQYYRDIESPIFKSWPKEDQELFHELFGPDSNWRDRDHDPFADGEFDSIPGVKESKKGRK